MAGTVADIAGGTGTTRLRVGWRRSLRTRLMLWSTASSLVLLAVVALVFYALIRTVMIGHAKDELRDFATQSARSLEATLGSVAVSGRTLAAGAANLGRQPANLRALLVSAVEGDPDIVGAMLILEPGALPGDVRGFSWYVRRDGDGFAESSVEDLGYDYRTMPWYLRTTGAPGPWWSEPYANAATANVHFTTYNLALRAAGARPDATPIGMVSVDVPVARLRAMIAREAGGQGAETWLLSPEGRLVAHPDATLALRATLDDLIARGRADLAPLADARAAGRDAEIEHVVPGAEDARFTVLRRLGASGWSLVVSVPEAAIVAPLRRTALWALVGGLAAVLLAGFVIRRSSRAIARPIEDLTDSAGHFAAGEFDYPLRHVARADEVGVMARAFDNARGSIKRQLAEIASMTAARQRLESELDIARDIQLAMLPAGRALVADRRVVDARARLEPARAVGGDFYAFFERAPGRLWFVIGDVSDKGVPAALFMARAMTVLEAAARVQGTPDAALVHASRRLVEGNDTCMFATVLCGELDVASGALVLASAGHDAPVLLRADGSCAAVPMASSGPLGFEPLAEVPTWRGALAPGDALVAVTDGITEAFDAQGRAFGEARMRATLAGARDADADGLCAALVAAVHAFADGAPQSDDITVLALRYAAATTEVGDAVAA